MLGRRGARAVVMGACMAALAACGVGGSNGESTPMGGGAGGGSVTTGGGGGGGSTNNDAGVVITLVPDAGPVDAGSFDAGAPVDAGQPEDAGTPVVDAGTPDAGNGGIVFGTPGPWPVQNVTYGSTQGIQETPIIGITTDESQNIWVATHQALYLMKPGSSSFKRFASADGLHLQDNPFYYNDVSFTGDASQNHVPGAAVSPGIMEIVGGGPNEVFVGYAGDESGDGTKADAARHTGKIDQVKLNADGTLTVNRFDLVANQHGMEYWHNRTIYKMAYDHFVHPHTLYAGTNHGVDMLFPDKYTPAPNNGSFADTYNLTWMGDHLHARVCYHMTCPDNSEEGQRMGEWRGLAIDKNGDLWHAGRWTAGLIKYSSDLSSSNFATNWYLRGGGAFKYAFGDPYPTAANENGYINQPVFIVPQEGDAVSLSAVTVTPDGKAWFSSEPWYGTGVDATAYGIASWDGQKFKYVNPTTDLGAPEMLVHDMVALPDGRIAIGFPNSGLLLWNPDTNAKTWIHGGGGIADDHIQRLELDTMVSPPALHVATYGGASVIRVIPQ